MPSPRRMRLVMLAAVTTVIIIFFYTSRIESKTGREGRSLQDFYDRTVNAMDKGERLQQQQQQQQPPAEAPNSPPSTNPLPVADRDRDGDIDADDEIMGVEMQERLKAAELRAKEHANSRAGFKPDPPSDLVGVGSAAQGQGEHSDDGSSSGDSEKSEAQVHAETELNSILKKSPIIIFSKTYCPHSKRAKTILLEKYDIVPEPYVVELDEHAQGSDLQDVLLDKTGRRTVPNVLIQGVSIGGADDVVQLHEDGELMDKVWELGLKRVEISRKPDVRGGSRY